MRSNLIAVGIGALAVSAGAAVGAELSSTVENLGPAGGTALTPVWFGFQNGSFETFVPGENTADFVGAGIEEIAELGDTGPISDRFGSEQPGGTDFTFASSMGAPVFSGGESETTTVDVSDPGTYRFVNFASMVVPTNDLFVGNSAGIEVFNADGSFAGPVVIELFGSDVWDNGSEVNDITDGPAFIQGIDATGGTAENGVARLLFGSGDDAGAQAYLDSVVGVTTAPGFEITSVFGAQDPIARITIVPAPGAAGVLGVGGLAAARRRRG